MDNEEVELLTYELERRRINEPLRFFRPNGAQEKFINAVADPDSRIILFPAGNWIGKTAGAIALLGACSWPDMAEDEIFNKPIFKDWTSFGYKKNARIISTPKELESIGSIQKEILTWWPKGRYTANKKGKQFPCEFISDTGWVTDLMSYEQSIDEFEGATISLFILNEPPPEEIFDACLSRMKFGGKILMPLTPLNNSAWIYDRLVANEGKNGIRVIYGDTEDNCREHGKNGVIPHAAIQALSDSCDPDDREARLHGKFSHMAGQIFKTFKRDVHVVKIEDINAFLQGKTIYQVVDPAIGKPLACIWAAVDHSGVVTIYDEYPSFEFQGSRDSNMTVPDYVELFKTKEEGRKVDIRILDRHFGNVRRTLGGLTLKQEFGERGIDFMDSYSIADVSTEVETGILRVKDYLRYNTTKPIDSINRPKIYVAENCINVLHSMERWRRDEKTGKPKEDYKDFCDCVRYLLMGNPEVQVERIWESRAAHYGVGN